MPIYFLEDHVEVSIEFQLKIYNLMFPQHKGHFSTKWVKIFSPVTTKSSQTTIIWQKEQEELK